MNDICGVFGQGSSKPPLFFGKQDSVRVFGFYCLELINVIEHMTMDKYDLLANQLANLGCC